jgi:hypothetical protein
MPKGRCAETAVLRASVERGPAGPHVEGRPGTPSEGAAYWAVKNFTIWWPMAWGGPPARSGIQQATT